ncbi:hypothetical protein MK079_00645 [Candidatus Gracilibacteria bacterium]|nr:hypothetical protein [Candidatus Gracilibacteria bacterium]
MANARLTLDIPKELSQTLKMLSASYDISMKAYILDAIVQKIQSDEALEDMIWGTLARAEDKKENYVGKKSSKELLDNLISA